MDYSETKPMYPLWVVGVSKTISVIFHPVFAGVMMMYYITIVNHDIFLAVSDRSRLLKLLTFTNNNLVFPVLIVLLLRGLGFTKSVKLVTQRDRIVPYMASIIFQFWTWYVFRNHGDSPVVLTDMCQGIFLSTSLALVINNFMKVSMHAIGMGGLTGMMLVVTYAGFESNGLWLMLSFLIAGLVCTARMITADHDYAEIIVGFFIGFGMQWLAYQW